MMLEVITERTGLFGLHPALPKSLSSITHDRYHLGLYPNYGGNWGVFFKLGMLFQCAGLFYAY